LEAPRRAPDLEVAFAAGTPEPDGSVLVAGTGAAAGAVTDHRKCLPSLLHRGRARQGEHTKVNSVGALLDPQPLDQGFGV
jgi:hypothetical protein